MQKRVQSRSGQVKHLKPVLPPALFVFVRCRSATHSTCFVLTFGANGLGHTLPPSMPRESNSRGHSSSPGLGCVLHAFAWSCQPKESLSMRPGHGLAASIVYYYSNPGVLRAFSLVRFSAWAPQGLILDLWPMSRHDTHLHTLTAYFGQLVAIDLQRNLTPETFER